MSGGYDVAWKLTGTNDYTVWTTDANGNFVSDSIGLALGTSVALKSFEPVFGQDLNGDGVIGLYAAPGTTLQISSALAGPSGSATIGTGATLTLAAADSGSVTFASSTGALILDRSSTFSGKIYQFHRKRHPVRLRSNRPDGHKIQFSSRQLLKRRPDSDGWQWRHRQSELQWLLRFGQF